MAVLVACGATVVGRRMSTQARKSPGDSFMNATRDDLRRWLDLMAPSGGDDDGRLHEVRTRDHIAGAIACEDRHDVDGSNLSGSFAANIRSRVLQAQLRLPEAPAPRDGGIVLAFNLRTCWAARFCATSWSGTVVRGLGQPNGMPGGRDGSGGDMGGSSARSGNVTGPRAPGLA